MKKRIKKIFLVILPWCKNKKLGGTRVIGSFKVLEDAQIFCNEIILNELKDFYDYYDLIISRRV